MPLTLTNINQYLEINFNENATISELINPDGPHWKHEIIQALFPVEEAHMVESIPLSLIDKQN